MFGEIDKKTRNVPPFTAGSKIIYILIGSSNALMYFDGPNVEVDEDEASWRRWEEENRDIMEAPITS